MGFINVSVSQIGKTANSATYRCVVSCARNSYYGININTAPIGVFDHNGCFYYIGWPKRSAWRSGWGTPDYRFDGRWVDSWWGNHQADLLEDFTFTFERTVSINRGNSRKGTKYIEVGVHSGYDDMGYRTDFNTCMRGITLETSTIAEAKVSGNLTCSVDSPQVADRYIRLNANFSNPENFYTAKLYDKNNKEIKSSTGTSISLNIPITKDMYQTNVSYTCKIWGKDGKCYDTKTTGTVYVEPSGVGVTVKNSGIHDVSTMNFRNVNTKEIKEVWIKINDKIYQTRK